MYIDTVKFYNSLLERAGLYGFGEGQKVSYGTREDRRSGKIAVDKIQLA